jgi:hypothetical protein
MQPLSTSDSAGRAGRDRQNVIAVIVFSAGILWQIYAVVLASRHAATFQSLFAGLGGPLPLVTRAFFASYPYWVILPVSFGLLAMDVLRRREPPLPYFAAVLAGTYAAALLLHAWVQEAFFAPLFSILHKIG